MPVAANPDLKYWLGFNLVKGIGPARLQALLDYFGTMERAWHAGSSELQRIGIDQRSSRNLAEARAALDLDRELARVERSGTRLLTWNTPGYPRYLREIPAPPPLLYVRGELTEADQWAIAVVGTRRLTSYGRQVTRQLVSGLVSAQVTIVSGLAKGIDAVAHRTALELGGRTIAVLGCGLDVTYPPQHKDLAHQILDGQGALISDYGLGVQPDAKNFPPRNRIISGLSLGVLVVEAGIRSGALITAGFALEQGREVFAVPGNINSPASKGTNRLIQDGAKLVGSVDDILDELNLSMVAEKTAVQLAMPESAEEAALLPLMSHEPIHIDDLIRQARLPSALVASTLTLMELKGMVHQVGGMKYVIGREPDPTYSLDGEPDAG
jgi:DNA processing protein